MTDAPIRVLFVCTHNSARSQIAEALLARLRRDRLRGLLGRDGAEDRQPVRDRGPGRPRDRLVRGDRASRSAEFLDQRFDYVITVCDRARADVPGLPGREQPLHWGLDDPAEVEGTDDEKLAAFRADGMELTLRLRPFIEIALRAAGRTRGVTTPR